MIRKTSETRALAGNIVNAYNNSQTSAYSTNFLNNKIIEESGGSGNNHYIKYSDGIMICYGSFSFSTSNWSSWGNAYDFEKTNPVTFAQEFKENPYVHVNTSNALACMIGYVTHSKTGITKMDIVRPITTGGISPMFDYIAIGTWK